MEQAQGERRPSKYDIISSMPDNITTNIMDRLPILDAVRTSVLSINWRFKWTMITQLVCNEDLFKNIRDEKEYVRIISKLLSSLKGPITKFSVYIQDKCYFEDIYQWVMFLSHKGIKDFTLTNGGRRLTPLKLLSHLFSCEELKHLELKSCLFYPIHSFRGFPNLLSLELNDVSFESYDFGEFLTQCPLLEILKISIDTICKMKEAKMAKLENLKVIWLPMCKLENMAMMTNSSVIQLGSLWPKLQKLKLDFLDCKLLEDGTARLPNAFPCLKSLKLRRVNFNSKAMVSCAIELIYSSPNLQSLQITARYYDVFQQSAVSFSKADYSRIADSFSKVDYSRIWQLQLRKVHLQCFRGSEIEICLIKNLLRFSPLLKKMTVSCQSSETFGGERGGKIFATELLKARCASLATKIDIIWF